MPTTSMASADSRQTMKRAFPMASRWPRALPGDQPTLSGLLVEVVEKPVFAGLQRVDRHRRLAARWNDLFLLEIAALELDRRLAIVDDFETNARARRDLDDRRIERAVARHQLVERRIGRECRRARCNRDDEREHGPQCGGSLQEHEGGKRGGVHWDLQIARAGSTQA